MSGQNLVNISGFEDLKGIFANESLIWLHFYRKANANVIQSLDESENPITFSYYLDKMNSYLKSVLLGLGLGLFPFLACTLLYLITPYLVKGNPGALLSFAVLGLYVVGSIAVFVVSIILLVRKKTMVGSVAIITLFLQAIAAISFLANA